MNFEHMPELKSPYGLPDRDGRDDSADRGNVVGGVNVGTGFEP